MDKLKTNPLIKLKYSRFGYYELIIFLFLLFEFFILKPDEVFNTNTKTAYLLTYEFGFASQSLIGSIFTLFTKFITSRLIYITAIVSFLFLILLISLLLGNIIRNSQADAQVSTMIFIILFLSSPLSVTYLVGFHFGRLDTYWIILTLLGLILLKKPVLRWLIPILCAAAISIHQGYFFTYMPALLIPIFYELYKNKYSKSNYAILGLTCLTAVGLFAYFQFSPSKIPYARAVDFANHLSKITDFEPSAIMLHIGFFAPIKEWLFEYVWPITSSFALQLSVLFLVFSLPLIIIFIYIWRNSARHTHSKYLKFIFILSAFAPLIFVLSAIFVNDWDRYWAAIINNQFIILFYLIYSKETIVIDAVKLVGSFLNKHILVLLLIIVLTNSLTFSVTVNMFSFVHNSGKIAKVLDEYTREKVFGIITGK